jgi:hypothetical protein
MSEELNRAIKTTALVGIKEELKIIAAHVEQLKDLLSVGGVCYVQAFGGSFGPYDFDVGIEMYKKYANFLNDILTKSGEEKISVDRSEFSKAIKAKFLAGIKS